jgi:hypothetical protein
MSVLAVIDTSHWQTQLSISYVYVCMFVIKPTECMYTISISIQNVDQSSLQITVYMSQFLINLIYTIIINRTHCHATIIKGSNCKHSHWHITMPILCDITNCARCVDMLIKAISHTPVISLIINDYVRRCI